jgi:hypothetical protein
MTKDEALEYDICNEASIRLRGNPDQCGLRIMAEVTLEFDKRKVRVHIDKHVCKNAAKGNPCPLTLFRT